MKKSIILVFAGLMVGFTASAQLQKKIEKEFEKFNTVKVENDFVVKLHKSEKYSVRVNVDERLAAHVQAYEKNGTLYLLLDEKGFSKELKKELRQRGAVAPILEAEVYMPSLKSIIMMDKSNLAYCDELKVEKFTLTASDDVKIVNLKVDCETADLDVASSVEMTAEMKVSDKLNLKASKSAKVSLSQTGGSAEIELAGSSNLEMKAAVEYMAIKASSGAESQISGTASDLTVSTSGYSKTDVEQLEVKEGEFEMAGSSKCYSNVTDKMKVNLIGGSMLTFKATPQIEVERIVNSTLIKADDSKRK